MIAIRPPEYFPRCAYAALLLHVDHFVIADTFQYSRQSFQNRSKLRNPQGWQWITIPLFGSASGRPIHDVDLARRDRWRTQHWRALFYNYRSTMYFAHYQDDFQSFFDEEWSRLGPCTSRSVELTADLLKITTPITRASDIDGAPATTAAIADAMGDDTLLVPPGAAPHDADAAQHLRVLRYEHPTYRQNFEGFETGMSALDVMLNYGPECQRMIEGGSRIEEWEA